MLKKQIQHALSLPLIACGLAAPKKNTVGGQAIIEGVMMRGKEMVSWAVQPGTGNAIVESFPFVSLSKKSSFWKLPVARGAVNLFESLQLGMKALTRSAELVEADENGVRAKKPLDDVISFLTIAVSLAISLIFFLYLPLKVVSFFVRPDSAFLYNLLAGALRLTFFLIYLWGISFLKDVRRLFEYHGAEHKVIFAYEDGKDLTVDSARPYTTFHPRCGTSFLLLVALVCIVLFGIIDGVIFHFFGPYPSPTVLTRTLAHLSLVPFVSGISYEVLKLSDTFKDNPVVKLLITPGLMLQRITTRNPDDAQIGVALKALTAVI